MKICNSCGAQMNDTDRFCMSCGADQRVAEAAPVTPAAEPDPVVEPTPVVEPVQTYTPVEPTPAYTYDTNSYTAPAENPGNGLSIASLILGIAGIVCCIPPCSIVGLILGIVAKNKGSKSGMATAGIVLGAIGCALTVIFIILYAIGEASFYINY